MNKDLEQFENRSDDWLAKQRNIENKTSAWDIDEGKRIKEIHEENCEAKEIKERHEKIHSGQIRPRKKNGASIFLIVIIIMAAADMIPAIVNENDYVGIPIAVLCMVVFGLALSSAIKKGRK